MGNMVDLLLGNNKKDNRLSEEIEIPRLSEAFGEPFTLLVKGLYYDKFVEIEEKLQNNKNKAANILVEVVFLGCFNPSDGSRFFSNETLREHYGVHKQHNHELVKVLLTPGEIAEISGKIFELCGSKEDVIKTVKN